MPRPLRTRTLGLTDFRDELGTVALLIAKGLGPRVLLQRNGRPMCAVVSCADLERLRESDKSQGGDK